MTRRPALMLVLAFAAGIGALNSFGPVPLLFIALGVLAAAVLTLRWQRPGGGACLMALFFLCGAFAAWDRGLLALNHIRVDLDDLKGRAADVVCRVASPPEKETKGLSPKSVFVCELQQVNGRARAGRVIVHLYGGGNFIYGDRVHLTGRLARPFDFSPGGKISYRHYLERQGVHALLHVRKTGGRELVASPAAVTFEGVTLAVRLHLQDVFRRYLSPGEAGLMNAMLLGPRGDIPGHVYDVFRKTGTAHIIAISGMNMTLTAVGVMLLLGLFNVPRGPRAVLAVVILAFYSCMAGNSAPVARSALMAGVVILGFIIERESDGLNTLGWAALVLLAADPGQLGDIGFQLSFVCVASLILLAPLILAPFEAMGWRERPFIWFLAESACVTLAAFIGSAGILAYDFGYLAPVGLIVNLPVIPLMALVTTLGAAVLLAGLALPLMAIPFALCLKIVLNAAVWILSMAAHAPVIRGDQMPAWFAAAYYGILVFMTACFYYKRGREERFGRAGPFIDKPYPL